MQNIARTTAVVVLLLWSIVVVLWATYYHTAELLMQRGLYCPVCVLLGRAVGGCFEHPAVAVLRRRLVVALEQRCLVLSYYHCCERIATLSCSLSVSVFFVVVFFSFFLCCPVFFCGTYMITYSVVEAPALELSR